MARLASAAKWREWEERLARFERSVLPMRQFCEAERVNPGTVWYWRRNLMGSATPRPSTQLKSSAAFAPVDVVTQPATGCVVVRLPRGASIELPGDRPDLRMSLVSG
jgi:hypothetical protein